MISALRAYWMTGIAVIVFMGLSGCGQKHLTVSTTSGKANEEGEIEASLRGAPSKQSGIQGTSLSESGLGGELASKDAGGQESALAAPVSPSSRQGEGAGDSSQTSDTASLADSPPGSLEPSTQETIQGSTPSGSSERDQTPSDSTEGAPVVAFGSPETAQAAQTNGSSDRAPHDQGELTESAHVERMPENIVIAKVEPSDAIEEQLARIKKEELATVSAGLQNVYFEFDSWKITEAGREALEQNANWLQEQSSTNLLIEGHCDQRGTQAYNIVLGKKRAIAIRDYLVQLGIESSRLSTITYGKEKPFCTDETENCYQENRRGHFRVQTP